MDGCWPTPLEAGTVNNVELHGADGFLVAQNQPKAVLLMA